MKFAQISRCSDSQNHCDVWEVFEDRDDALDADSSCPYSRVVAVEDDFDDMWIWGDIAQQMPSVGRERVK